MTSLCWNRATCMTRSSSVMLAAGGIQYTRTCLAVDRVFLRRTNKTLQVYVIVIVRAVIPAATGINYRGIDRMYVDPSTVCLFIIDAVGPMI